MSNEPTSSSARWSILGLQSRNRPRFPTADDEDMVILFQLRYKHLASLQSLTAVLMFVAAFVLESELCVLHYLGKPCSLQLRRGSIA